MSEEAREGDDAPDREDAPDRDRDRDDAPDRDEDPVAERRATEEADAAAAEAARVGGASGDEDRDPAERPLAEAGGGTAEGFEESERDLVEHASHGDPAPDPSDEEQISREPEREDESVRGAADHFHSSEQEDEERFH